MRLRSLIQNYVLPFRISETLRIFVKIFKSKLVRKLEDSPIIPFRFSPINPRFQEIVMKRTAGLLLIAVLSLQTAISQKPTAPQKPGEQEPIPDDVIRISTQLVQTDVVVTDKDGKIIKDLKLED